MAKLYRAGPFVGRGEQRVAAVLENGLPDTWTVICNKELVNPDESTVEVDFIVVGKHGVYVLEEKSWEGPIHGNVNGWVLPTGESQKSPLAQANYIARRLAGLLRETVPGLKERVGKVHFVFPRVILSADGVRLYVQDPRAGTEVLHVTDAVEGLRSFDQELVRQCSIQPFHRDIVRQLTGLPNRPAIPRKVGDYQVLEYLGVEGPVRTLRARHADGTERLLKLIRRPQTADTVHARDAEEALLREYMALKSLAAEKVAPEVEPYFSWDDGGCWVVPVNPVEGESLRTHRTSAAPSPSDILPVFEAAFASLEKVHRAGIVHRALTPDRVILVDQSEGVSILFTDFALARIEGGKTVAPMLQQMKLDPENHYRAPECRLGLELATPRSDVYSLAACLFYWLTDFEPSHEENEQPSDFPPVKGLRTDLREDDARFLDNLFRDCLQDDDQKRPSAGEVVNSIREHMQQVRERQARKHSEERVYEVGDMIDQQHQVIRCLGRGGTADTYLVRDLVADELRVLKRIRNPGLYEKLSRSEFQALQRLHHRHLRRVYDIRPWSDPFHLKLEYVPGASLREIRDSLKGDREECLRIGRAVLEALDYLAQHGLTHRDVSPGNIIVPDEADLPVKLIDFDLATAQASQRGAAGTPDYRAPEVEKGRPATPLSDSYSLGVVLFEALTGRLPYRIDGEKRCKLELVHPTSEEQAECGASLLRVLMKAVAPEPEERYQSAREFLEALDRASAERDERSESGERRTNPFVDELRRAYRNSRIGNTNNRGLEGTFSQQTYVLTRLDRELLPRIADGAYRLVVLSGNPGDGKTALLQRLREMLETTEAIAEYDDPAGWCLRRGNHSFAALYDASESHEGTSADELFHRLLAPLAGRAEPPAGYTGCVAINDGRLRDFFERNGALRYPWLWDRLRPQLDGKAGDRDGVVLVDMKRRSLATTDPTSPSVLQQILDRFLAPECWEACRGCVARNECPIWWNVQSMSSGVLGPDIRHRLNQLLLGIHLRRERRPTIRDLRSALAFLITHDLGCQDIHRERDEGRSPLTQTTRLYFNAAFSGDGSPDLVLDELQNFDPALVPSPRLDRFLHFHRTKRFFGAVERLFRQVPERPTVDFSLLKETERFQALKRRYFFEAETPGDKPAAMPRPEQLVPYRHMHRFIDAITGRIDLRTLRDELLGGMSRADSVPLLPRFSGLGLRLTEASSPEIVVIKKFPADEFEVSLPTPAETPVETVPDYLILKHLRSRTELLIGLDLFEYLQRALEGYLSGSEEQQALLEELALFKAQLLLQPTDEVLLIESGDRVHRVTLCDGRIALQESGQ